MSRSRVGTTLRWAAVLVGLVALGVALLTAISPSVERTIPIEELVAAVGNDYILVAILGIAAIAITVGVLLERAVTGIDENTLPLVERATSETPGSDVDSVITDSPWVRVTDRQRRLHARLRKTAVDTLVVTRGHSRRVGRERVNSGRWSEDESVAAFLSSETLEPPSVPRRLLSRLSGNHWFRQRVEATVRELDAMERRSDR